MENEINIEIKKDDNFVAANKRSDTYALKRNLQALEFNEAIITRQLAESKNQVKCEKCGKEFAAGIASDTSLICPKCK
jgi:Zn finger protein HypA/HybF involved in hydrogenase expression